MSRKGQRNPSSSQGRLRRLRPLLEGALAASLASQLPHSVASAAPPLSGRGRFVAIDAHAVKTRTNNAAYPSRVCVLCETI